MTAFCASCAREMLDGPVLRGGWLYCSFAWARVPGASGSAWRGRIDAGGGEPALKTGWAPTVGAPVAAAGR